MTIRLHRGDLPDISRYSGAVAIDTETMGLDLNRDRLCVVQLSPGDGSADVVQIAPHASADSAPNLKRLLTDTKLLKIFHFARFDLGMLCKTYGVMPEPVFCTKIASRLTRTYTDRHGLKDLVREVLGPGNFQTTTIVGLGRSRAQRGASLLCRVRRDAFARAQGQALRHAGARGPRGAGGGLFPFPAGAGAARPCRLCRRRHICPFLRRRVLRSARGLRSLGHGPAWDIFASDFCGTNPLKAWFNVRIGAMLKDNRLAIAYPENAAKGLSTRPRGDFERSYRSALRHSRHVRWLRIGVPVGIAALLLTVVAMNYVPPIGGFRLPGELGNLVIHGTKITMEAPRLNGFTSDSRAYEFSANAAAQDMTKPDLVELQKLHAKMEMADKSTVEMTAVSGIYNVKSEISDAQREYRSGVVERLFGPT